MRTRQAPVLTPNTQRDRRVDRQPFRQDILATCKAIAIFIRLQPAQSGVQHRQPVPPPFLARKVHGLLLHRIHARQAANRLLVQFDRCPALPAAVTERAQLVNLLQDMCATACVAHGVVA